MEKKFVLIVMGLLMIFMLDLATSQSFGFNDPEENFGYNSVKVIASTNITISNVTLTGNFTAFLNLTDTPSTYSGQAGKILMVNGAEDGIVFATNVSSGGGGGATDGNFSEAYDVTRGTGGLNWTKTVNASTVSIQTIL